MRKSTSTLFFICIVLFSAGLFAGYKFIPLNNFIESDGTLNFIIKLRAMRLASAFTVGGCLALSGLIFQSVLRNVLAEPFTLGISGGASLGAVTAFMSGLYIITPFAVPLSAFAGAMIVLGIVLFLGRWGRAGSENLLLSGVIAGTVCSSVLMYLVSISKVDTLASVTWWMLGDLDAPDVRFLAATAAILIGVSVLARFGANDLDALSLGSERAFYLGTSPAKSTIIFVCAASLLAASSVALAGIISFCGLIVPHIVRRIYGTSNRKIVLKTVLAGGAFLMLCDTLARTVSDAKEIPVGVISAIIGGCFFLYLLNRKRSVEK